MKKFRRNLIMGCIALTCGITTVSAQVTIGADLSPAIGALLELKQQNSAPNDSVTATKGLLYPRVKLTNVNSLEPMISGGGNAAQKKDHIGLTVYNVRNNAVFTPGIYVWDGENWIRLVTKLPEVATTQVNAVDLLNNITTPTGDEYGTSTGTGGASGGELTFVNRSGVTTIEIPEDGSYAFSFNFYGAMDMTVNFYSESEKTAIYYLSLWKNNVTTASNLKDIAEIDMLVAKSTGTTRLVGVYTYSITMAAFFNKGDIVKFKLTAYSNNNIPWTLYANSYYRTASIKANRTSMVWWRL